MIFMIFFVITIGSLELVLEGLFTDFKISRDQFTDFQVMWMKAGLWLGIVFFSIVTLVMLHGITGFVQPLMRVVQRGIWLQTSARRFKLIEWSNIESLNIQEKKIPNLILPFLPLKLSTFSIKLKNRQKLRFVQKEASFKLEGLSFMPHDLKWAVEEYSSNKCTVTILIGSKKG
ncbi:hypothetical protein CRD36_00545 [Paremcibacter congregatus]|uniref:Uncharacterized protein n=2 Tax=Paremcibacter congregatus TaxID=2043170 RepID=A0A2G4YVP0_9PROT|nr:hypothetical protein CRD36_00545 [Paremcibacter congregatus]